MATKYIFVTGGVVSSLGKGITAASLGRLLKARGLKVAIQKFDPYFNVDAGMMSPLQHGEVYVTHDGGECDLDIGHYERFIDESLVFDNNVSAGRIYWSVIQREQEGGFDGNTVQVIPHITGEIKRRMMLAGRKSGMDVVITEIGGTVGDIESLPYLEAIRQIRAEMGSEHCLFIHVTLLPYLAMSGELKTKPTQHSVKELLGIGIQPDIIVCRTEMPIDEGAREKIALFCNVEVQNVIQNLDAPSLYEIPIILQGEGLDKQVCKHLGLDLPAPDLSDWCEMVLKHKSPKQKVRIALVGKYVALHDAYLSVSESLVHGGIASQTEIDILWLDSEELVSREAVEQALADVDGVIIPGGFGQRGLDGMIEAAHYAREVGIPCFGIGLGMQMMAVEFARNVLSLGGAHVIEAHPDTLNPVTVSGSHRDKGNKGIIRLGHYPCSLQEGSLAHRLYGEDEVLERHRHRYEINPALVEPFAAHGLNAVGLCTNGGEIEVLELADHPFYIGVSFHAEFQSRPNRPHPLFTGFVDAANARRNARD